MRWIVTFLDLSGQLRQRHLSVAHIGELTDQAVMVVQQADGNPGAILKLELAPLP